MQNPIPQTGNLYRVMQQPNKAREDSSDFDDFDDMDLPDEMVYNAEESINANLLNGSVSETNQYIKFQQIPQVHESRVNKSNAEMFNIRVNNEIPTPKTPFLNALIANNNGHEVEHVNFDNNEQIPSFRQHQPEDQYVIGSHESLDPRMQEPMVYEEVIHYVPMSRGTRQLGDSVTKKRAPKTTFENLDSKDQEILNKSAALIGMSKFYQQNQEGSLQEMSEHQGGNL